MAINKKKSKKSLKRKSPGRRGLTVLGIMAGIIVVIIGMMLLVKAKPELPVSSVVLGRFGSKGMAPGQLDSPRGIAVNSQGDVYVTDLGNARINKYSAQGVFIQSFGKHGAEQGKNGPGEFREPSGVAVDKEGNVYVADAWNGRIQKFNAKGKFLMELSGVRYSFYSPRNVTVDKNGNIYVADTGNSAVKTYNSAGVLIKEIGGRGKGGGNFTEVFGLAINSKGEIFVADPGNQRIHKFGALPEAKFIKYGKVPGWQEGIPFWPHLTVDAQDHIYAVDNTHAKIWIYDSELNYLGTLGGDQAKPLFASPVGIAAFGTEIYVSDKDANRIVRLGSIALPVNGGKP